jgi:hypothetical protein
MSQQLCVIWLFDNSVWLVSADVNVTADVCDLDVCLCVVVFRGRKCHSSCVCIGCLCG